MRYPWGNDFDPSGCSYLSDRSGQTPAGHAADRLVFPATRSGLCNMIGNVWEWVSDWLDPWHCGGGDHRNPAGPRDGKQRGQVRGGSWVTEEVAMLRCSYRHKVPPDRPTRTA